MNNYPTIRIKFDRKGRSSKTAKAPVEVIVTYNRRYICLQTGVRLLKHQWNEKNSVARGCEFAEVMNERIATTYKKVCDVTNDLWRSGDFSLDILRDTVKMRTSCDVDVFEWMSNFVSAKQCRRNTKKQDFSVISIVKSSGVFSKWSDFTKKNIVALDDFFNGKNLSAGTKFEYHCKLRNLLSAAADREMIKDNPYSKYKIERGKTEKIKFLTDKERQKIEDADLSGNLARVRDCYIFACYTGLSFADLAKFDMSKSVKTKDGVRYIVGDRVKTGVRYVTILPDKAKSIADKYDGSLPLMSDSRMNVLLKRIGQMLGIHKRLTMHTARHTFATWALHNGIPLEIVSKTLGHSSVRTTEVYAKVLEDDIMKTISKLS